jgi:hypothetical protein
MLIPGQMRRQPKPVLGVTAAPPRPTFVGALWLACVLSVPVFVVLGLVELVWRLAGG